MAAEDSRPRPSVKFSLFDEGKDGLDVFAVDRVEAEAELEAVVLGGIVAGGDHDAAVFFQLLDRKVKNRRRAHPDIGHVTAGRQESLDQFLRIGLGGQAAVASHGDTAGVVPAQKGSHATADQGRVRRRHVLAGDAPDVILPEHLWIHQSLSFWVSNLR